jgi:hypothetical protein
VIKNNDTFAKLLQIKIRSNKSFYHSTKEHLTLEINCFLVHKRQGFVTKISSGAKKCLKFSTWKSSTFFA